MCGVVLRKSKRHVNGYVKAKKVIMDKLFLCMLVV